VHLASGLLPDWVAVQTPTELTNFVYQSVVQSEEINEQPIQRFPVNAATKQTEKVDATAWLMFSSTPTLQCNHK
jgi:hypothetical protein